MNTRWKTQVKVSSTPKSSFAPVRTSLLQPKCACGGTSSLDGECAECRQKRLSLPHRSIDSGEFSPVSPLVHSALRVADQPLDSATRAVVEPRFGHDFSRVQVHTDTHVAQMAHVSALPMHMAQAVDHHTLSGSDQGMARPDHEPIRSKKIAGLDVTKSHCSCLSKIPEKIKWAQFMAKLYGDCGTDAKLKTGTDIENCVDGELVKKGIITSVAGTTSPAGAVTVKKSPGTCGPIWDKGTEIHEGVHQSTQRSLEKTHGKGTPAFKAAWDDAKNWATDEVNSYNAEIPFYQAVAAYLQSVCGGGGFSGTGAAIGGGVGGLAGAGLGFAIGGPIGALVGGLLGGAVGLLAGGFLGGE